MAKLTRLIHDLPLAALTGAATAPLTLAGLAAVGNLPPTSETGSSGGSGAALAAVGFVIAIFGLGMDRTRRLTLTGLGLVGSLVWVLALAHLGLPHTEPFWLAGAVVAGVGLAVVKGGDRATAFLAGVQAVTTALSLVVAGTTLVGHGALPGLLGLLLPLAVVAGAVWCATRPGAWWLMGAVAVASLAGAVALGWAGVLGQLIDLSAYTQSAGVSLGGAGFAGAAGGLVVLLLGTGVVVMLTVTAKVFLILLPWIIFINLWAARDRRRRRDYYY